MRFIKKIPDYLLTLLFISVGLTAYILPAYGRKVSGSVLGLFLIIFSKKRRDITLDNISKAFPERDGKWQRRVLKESYKNLGITLIELAGMNYFSDNYLRKIIKIEDPEMIMEKYKLGKGIILLSGHYANWEFAAYFSGLLVHSPITMVVHPLKNHVIDTLVNNRRAKHGGLVVPMKNAARNLVATLLRGGVVGLLADQSATYDKDIYVDFFGRPCATFTAPAVLALRFRSVLLFGYCERLKNGKYQMVIKEVNTDDLPNDATGVEELTKRHVGMLEEQIRRNPGQWSWMHRRWKHESRAHKS